MKTLYQQYLEAQEEWERKHQENLESKSSRFDELCERISDEDLELVKIGTQFVVTTLYGEEISERFDNLDEVEDWLNDPEFVFDE